MKKLIAGRSKTMLVAALAASFVAAGPAEAKVCKSVWGAPAKLRANPDTSCRFARETQRAVTRWARAHNGHAANDQLFKPRVFGLRLRCWWTIGGNDSRWWMNLYCHRYHPHRGVQSFSGGRQ